MAWSIRYHGAFQRAALVLLGLGGALGALGGLVAIDRPQAPAGGGGRHRRARLGAGRGARPGTAVRGRCRRRWARWRGSAWPG